MDTLPTPLEYRRHPFQNECLCRFSPQDIVDFAGLPTNEKTVVISMSLVTFQSRLFLVKKFQKMPESRFNQ